MRPEHPRTADENDAWWGSWDHNLARRVWSTSIAYTPGARKQIKKTSHRTDRRRARTDCRDGRD